MKQLRLSQNDSPTLAGWAVVRAPTPGIPNAQLPLKEFPAGHYVAATKEAKRYSQLFPTKPITVIALFSFKKADGTYGKKPGVFPNWYYSNGARKYTTINLQEVLPI